MEKKEATTLNDVWSFWYAPRGRKIIDNDDYENNLKKLGTYFQESQAYR